MQKNKNTLPKVILLYTGGTIGMVSDKTIKVPKLEANQLKLQFIKRIPELCELADCQVEVLFNRDSAHLASDAWLEIARKIQEYSSLPLKKRPKGIVILHGTDTMAYAACALSFLIPSPVFPIIFTGSQRPLSEIRTDARRNLISSVEMIAKSSPLNLKQVMVFFDKNLFQGNRVQKRTARDYAAFESPWAEPLAQVGTQINYKHKVSYQSVNFPQSFKKLKLKKMPARIVSLQITPDFPAKAFQGEFFLGVDGVVLEVFASGTAPTHDVQFLNFLKELYRRKIPVVIVSAGGSPKHYEAGLKLLKYGGLWAYDLTPECAYVKLAWLLSILRESKKYQFSQFKKYWEINYANEFTKKSR